MGIGIEVLEEATEPPELVGVVVVVERAPVGDVHAAHPHAAARRSDDACVGVGIAAAGEVRDDVVEADLGTGSPRRSTGLGRGVHTSSRALRTPASERRRRPAWSPAAGRRRAAPRSATASTRSWRARSELMFQVTIRITSIRRPTPRRSRPPPSSGDPSSSPPVFFAAVFFAGRLLRRRLLRRRLLRRRLLGAPSSWPPSSSPAFFLAAVFLAAVFLAAVFLAAAFLAAVFFAAVFFAAVFLPASSWPAPLLGRGLLLGRRLLRCGRRGGLVELVGVVGFDRGCDGIGGEIGERAVDAASCGREAHDHDRDRLADLHDALRAPRCGVGHQPQRDVAAHVGVADRDVGTVRGVRIDGPVDARADRVVLDEVEERHQLVDRIATLRSRLGRNRPSHRNRPPSGSMRASSTTSTTASTSRSRRRPRPSPYAPAVVTWAWASGPTPPCSRSEPCSRRATTRGGHDHPTTDDFRRPTPASPCG